MSRKFGPRPERNKEELHRINESIRVPQVRLIDADGTQVGVVPTRDALERAKRAGLDLVEITGAAVPPVCKILDYGKFKFELQKKAAESKKKQHISEVKELVLRPMTDTHDFEVKMRKAKEFLARGDKVKFNLRFRGRELSNTNLGMQMLEKVEQTLADVAKVDQKPKQEGRIMSMLVSPGTNKAKKAE